MPTEGNSKANKTEEDFLLMQFYNDLIAGVASPSSEYQKRFLLQLLNTKISKMEKNTAKKKALHFSLRVTAMVLSGVSTVILGFKFEGNTGLSITATNLALTITATVTLLSSLAVFWDTENYWIRNKIMLNKLKELRYEFAFYLAGAAAINTIDLRKYLDKFLASLGDEYWEKFLKDVKTESTDLQSAE